MIEIELRGKDGYPYVTESHPEFVDYALRESTTTVSTTTVSIHAENLVAPIIAAIADEHALSSYPRLANAATQVAGGFPNAEDAQRILALLVPWSRRYPEGIWKIAGAELVPRDVKYLAIPKEPRFSARSLSVDPMQRLEFIGDAEPMDDVDGLDLEPLERKDISITEAMRHPRSDPNDKSSSSSGGRSRKKSTEGGKTFLDCPLPSKPKTAVVRVPIEMKAVLDADPQAKEAFAALAAAITSGVSYAAAIEQIRSLSP